MNNDKDAVRKVICTHLQSLEDSLGCFIQTTHGAMFGSEINIDTVLIELFRTWECPTAFNISNFSQSIIAFLKSRDVQIEERL